MWQFLITVSIYLPCSHVNNFSLRYLPKRNENICSHIDLYSWPPPPPHLKQHGFELPGFTYTWLFFFFQWISTTVLQDLRLIESADRIWRADYKVILRVLTVQTPHYSKVNCTWKLIAVLLITAKNWEQLKCSLTDVYVYKLRYVHSMESSSALEENLLIHTDGWNFKTLCWMQEAKHKRLCVYIY